MREAVAPNRVPVGTLRLTAAFQAVYKALTPDWESIAYWCSVDEDCEPYPEEHAPQEDPHRREHEALRKAERIFRSALASSVVSAYIVDVASGLIVELDRQDWWLTGATAGIWSDYTSPSDLRAPGPDCTSVGVRQPVFVFRDRLDAWIKTLTKKPKRRKAASVNFRSAEYNNIRNALESGSVLKWVVAYFLEYHAAGLPADRLTKIIDNAIVKRIGSNRKTNREAYRLAMQIAKLTRSRKHWRTLGVPDLNTLASKAAEMAAQAKVAG